MSIIHDFKSIRRKLERQDQKAEFEEKNPPLYGYNGSFLSAIRDLKEHLERGCPR